MTWRDELRTYLAYLEGKGTSTNYLNNATTALRHLGRRFDTGSYLDLTREDLVTWFGELKRGGITGKKGLAEATMNTTFGQVKACLRWLNDGETPRSFRDLTYGRPGSRVEAREDLLTDDEFRRLVRVMTRDKRLICRLLKASGARPSEVLGLRRKDARPLEEKGQRYAELTFRITKTKKTRTVPLGDPKTVRELTDYLDRVDPNPETLLFPSPTREGKPLLYDSFLAYLKKNAKAVGIRKRVYSYIFRHMRATELMDRNTPRPAANKLMGWKEGMWENYAHLGTNDVRDLILEHEASPAEEDVETRLARQLRETWKEVARGSDDKVENVEVIIELSDRDEPLYVALRRPKDTPNETTRESPS